MSISIVKVVLAALLAVACIVALIIDADGNYVWAAPVLGILVGYVVGNTQVTENKPIVQKLPPPH